MNGDFEDDDLSDISDGDGDSSLRKRMTRGTKKSEKKSSYNPDELDSGDELDSDYLETRFTADGLLHVDKNGNVVRKLGESSNVNDEDSNKSCSSNDVAEACSDEDQASDAEDNAFDASGEEASACDIRSDDDSTGSSEYLSPVGILDIGTKVKGNYRATEQFEGRGAWYKGTISNVTIDKKTGNTFYDVEYDDGDLEEGMIVENIKVPKKTQDMMRSEKKKEVELSKIEQKRVKAKERAR